MANIKDSVPSDFTSPTALPTNSEQARQWQRANLTWWDSHPMRYDWKEAIDAREFTKEFYQEIDRRFFSRLQEFMPWKRIPFDPLVDFDALREREVLEIGVGNGSQAGLFAQYAHSFTGIDITDYAVKSTAKRMSCFGLAATIARMDAENMEFAENSFDFIWSWGVIHHSSNPRKILQEIYRVLKPGGEAMIMVYHRGLWNYYLIGGLIYVLEKGHWLKSKSLHEIVQLKTDGAIARYYSVSEWSTLASELFQIEEVKVYGSKAEVILMPGGIVKEKIMTLVPNSLARFWTNRCRMGSFLVSILKKTG